MKKQKHMSKTRAIKYRRKLDRIFKTAASIYNPHSPSRYVLQMILNIRWKWFNRIPEDI